jgi:hypothetical protein
MARANYGAQFLRIEPRRKIPQSDEVARDDGQVAAFGIDPWRDSRSSTRWARRPRAPPAVAPPPLPAPRRQSGSRDGAGFRSNPLPRLACRVYGEGLRSGRSGCCPPRPSRATPRRSTPPSRLARRNALPGLEAMQPHAGRAASARYRGTESRSWRPNGTVQKHASSFCDLTSIPEHFTTPSEALRDFRSARGQAVIATTHASNRRKAAGVMMA